MANSTMNRYTGAGVVSMPDPEARPPTIGELFDLTGKVALVTGARGHLGRAMAVALAEAGGRVVVTSRDEAAAHEVARSLPPVEEGAHIGVGLDYLDPDTIERGFAAAIERAGHLEILVNNGHQVLASDWRGVSSAEFDRQSAIGTGYFLLARLLRDHAVSRSVSASVIMLGSMYGLVASYPAAYELLCAANPAAYQFLKGGIVQLTRHLAVYWARDRVRVNVLSPGPFPSDQADARLVERLEPHSPMGRMGLPHEVKGAIVFLASDGSSYVTGHNLVVDGGWTAW
jgi:NAD(P)-dependent dehydrogenase (short-subunit alcohol dehydrogenase family)